MKDKSKIFGLAIFYLLLSYKIIYCFEWSEYKRIYVTSDGRVIDYFQNEISHSEGQGYALLLSVVNNDKKYFDRIWRWTKNNLQLRDGDNLFCWSWGKRPNGQWKVIDYNNASDGDILIALALHLAYKKWRNLSYKDEAQKIVKSIRQHLIFDISNKKVLLPGYYGFFKDTEIILNPSYLILPAFLEFAKLDNDQYWHEVYESQKEILQQCKFGLWKLPADWVSLDRTNKTIKISSKGAAFSFDAYRIFLYTSWIEEPLLQDSFDSLASFFIKNGFLPERINLKKSCLSLKDSSAGMYAVMGSYAYKFGDFSLANKFFKIADKKISFEQKDYYSATLYLLGKGNLGAYLN